MSGCDDEAIIHLFESTFTVSTMAALSHPTIRQVLCNMFPETHLTWWICRIHWAAFSHAGDWQVSRCFAFCRWADVFCRRLCRNTFLIYRLLGLQHINRVCCQRSFGGIVRTQHGTLKRPRRTKEDQWTRTVGRNRWDCNRGIFI